MTEETTELAFDTFHYKHASVTQIASDERLAVLGSDGTDVSC